MIKEEHIYIYKRCSFILIAIETRDDLYIHYSHPGVDRICNSQTNILTKMGICFKLLLSTS